MDPQLLRNIGIIAHIDAGKTTFTERLLFYTGVINRMGEVHDGSATMDFMPEERERGITIGAACTSCPWKGHLINVIDTPGHVDFTIEVERSLRVLDAAVGIFCGVAGVEPQSERVWKQAERFNIPKLAIVNKLDRDGASYGDTLLSLQAKLNVVPAPVTVPFGEGEEFAGVLDLIRQERICYAQDGTDKTERRPFDKKDALAAAPWRERLLDVLTQDDDTLLEVCLSGRSPTADMIDAALRRATLAGKAVPVFAMAALKNMGIQPVLDAIISYLPSPLDSPLPPELAAEAPVCHRQEFCGLVFKVVLSRGERILFLRLYTGALSKGYQLLNTRTGRWDEVAALFRVYAEDREPLPAAYQGDIVAITGVDAVTGDTLTSGDHIRLEPVEQGLPVISMVFETKKLEDDAILDEALDRAVWEDPTLHKERKDGSLLVSGMGELHLEVLRDRLQREYGLDIRLGNPHIVCREILRKSLEQSADLAFEAAGQMQYGNLRLAFSRQEEEQSLRIIFAEAASALDPAIADGVRRGIVESCASGNYGYPVVRCAVTVLEVGGGYTEDGLYAAAKYASANGLREGGTIVEEPIMTLVITVPLDHVGGVLTLLGMCGAHVEDCLAEIRHSKIIASAPLRQLFGFATRLRSSTQGRADLFMEFSHYAPTHGPT